MVEEGSDGYFNWKGGCNPFEVMDAVGKELVSTTVDRSRTLGNNANAVGKDLGNWKTLYMIVKMQVLMMP